MASPDDALRRIGSRLREDQEEGMLLRDPSAWERPAPADRFAKKSAIWRWVAVASLLAIAAGLWFANRLPVTVSGSIAEDVTWKRGRDYRLVGTVYIEGDTTLTIEPGVTVRGEFGSSLVVTRTARIAAAGTQEAPIVFTSARPAGHRSPGDWGGVVLLGNATVNEPDAHIEGISKLDTRGAFGGTDDLDSCGVVQFARIEFAGYEVYADNELNGLTLAGCGSATVIRNVQVHQALDDGVEIFGGTVDLRNIIISGAGDDGLDWDFGWRGRVQQLAIHQFGGTGDNAIEGDNNSRHSGAMPRSQPILYNITLTSQRNPSKGQRAIVLRSGSGGHFRNLLVQGFFTEALDLRGPIQPAVAAGNLTIAHSIFADVGYNGTTATHFEVGDADDDGSFDEAAWLSAVPTNQIRAQGPLTLYGDTERPDLRPSGSHRLPMGARVPQGEFWHEGASFIGAFPPGVGSDWSASWTAYPSR